MLYRRHRNRKAEYVQSLEAEIAHLQHLDAVTNNEKNLLAHQNRAIKKFLASHSLEIQLDTINLSSFSASSGDLSMLGSVEVDARFDPRIGQERVFLDLPKTRWSFPDVPMSEEQPKRPERHAPAKGDSWAALDFILALEWPCRKHVQHQDLKTEAELPKAGDVGGLYGYAPV